MAEERRLSTPTAEALSALEERFPGAVQPAEHVGLVVDPDQLVDVATFLRDEMDYAYLSCITGVDYPEPMNGFPPRFEAAYCLFRSRGGPLTLHAHADRDDPVLPSLASVWPSANVQEREAWDLLGIRFEGHPDLRRILLWEGFEGHPLRKDWHEAYYEEDQKPFRSRTRKEPTWVDKRTSFERNIRYPADWVDDGVLNVPDGWEPYAEDAVYAPLEEIASAGTDGVRTERIVLNVGPQHPSTHGVLRMVACLEGETVHGLQPVLGYLHRNHEKIGERNIWIANMPFTDRLDYITSMYNNFGYAVAVEKLLDVEVPERAEYIRVIMGELTRLMNHMVSVGFLCNDLGIYFTAMLYALQEREFVIDLFEMASGSRMMCNYFRFGGVAEDLPDDFVPLARELVFERFPRRIEELETYLLDNEVFRGRTKGVGILPPEVAVAYGCTGPLLRGSGVPYDVRRAEPYSIYDEFDWDVVVHNDADAFARVLVRFDEMRQSLRILRQALDRLPDGPILAGRKRKLANLRVPEGEAYGRVEHPKGELGFYVVSDGGGNPYRYHIRTPSFVNLGVLGELCRGHKIADVMAILGSIDITLGEVDR